MKNQREIKFRVWLKNRDEMVYKGDGLYIDGFTGDIYIPHFGNPNQLDKMDDVILMQFTGLKDKNGVEIFEGDILMIEKYSDKPQVIEWGEQFFESFYGMTGWKIKDSINYGFDSIEAKKSEVIGNIFESPELLK